MKYSAYAFIALLVSLFGLPGYVQAEVRFELQSQENSLTMTGSCESDVHIELYESENFEVDPIYTSVAPCISGQFAHDDNLLKWNIPDGEYQLVIDSDRHTVRSFIVKEPPVTTEEAVAREAREKGLPAEVGFTANQVFENAQASFAEKLYSLETDLITMQASLKDTTYPEFIKIGLGGALSVVEGATQKLSEAFFVVEQHDFVDPSSSIESLETSANTESIPTPTETTPDPLTGDTAVEADPEETSATDNVTP
jgi:hypothetical protein